MIWQGGPIDAVELSLHIVVSMTILVHLPNGVSYVKVVGSVEGPVHFQRPSENEEIACLYTVVGCKVVVGRATDEDDHIS